MAKIDLSRRIAAPSEQVFVFFVPQRMPYWYGPEMDSCFEVQDGAADFSVGLKVRVSGKLGSRVVSAYGRRHRVGTYRRRLLEWRFHDSYGVRGKERWELLRQPGPSSLTSSASTEAASTDVRFLSEYEMPGRLGLQPDDWLLTRHAVAQAQCANITGTFVHVWRSAAR